MRRGIFPLIVIFLSPKSRAQSATRLDTRNPLQLMLYLAKSGESLACESSSLPRSGLGHEIWANQMKAGSAARDRIEQEIEIEPLSIQGQSFLRRLTGTKP
jgi:hypothetical protein